MRPVPTLIPKLVLTPLLVGGASLAQRRWGPRVSGWIVALPLTTGPIVLFVAIEQGPAVGASVAHGAMAGVLAGVGFCLAYAWLAGRWPWHVCLLAAAIAFAAVGLLTPWTPPPATWVLAVGAILLGLRLLPDWPVPDAVAVRLPAWDVPARVIVATVLVLGISAAAPIVGGDRAGLIATFPVYASVLATFSHKLVGPAGAVEVLRGLLIGLPGFASFCLVAGALLDGGDPILVSLGVALVVGLGVQSAMYLLLTQRVRPGSLPR